MRRTKIICTIGPASESEDKLRELMLAGMDVARFNFSHGSHEEHKKKFARVIKISGELKLPVATLLDTKGPEIRLRDFTGGKAELKEGQKFVLTTEEVMGNSEKASITYKNLKNDIKEGMSILIDDGLIEMTVDEIGEEEIVCTVINGGWVSNHKGINVPNAVLSMPYISDTDREDIIFGCELGYDFIAASFVRCKEDILELRKILKKQNSFMKVIAKIENMQGIRNLEEILSVSDGIMVARGDMGVEIPLEEVPVLQKKMIKMAEEQGKHVITATQMLESMIRNPRPTRAEVTDIANAIYDGTTAIMLSGESAAGAYPVEAVKTMAKIAERSEQDIDYVSRMFGLSQYDAALKLIEDFVLPVDVKKNEGLNAQEKERIRKEKAEQKRIMHIQEQFEKWCSQTVDILKNCISEIDSVNHFLIGKPPDIIFSEDYAQMLHAEPVINYWLDILCVGEVSERRDFFLKDRKKVEEIAGKVCTGRKRIMECSRGSA